MVDAKFPGLKDVFEKAGAAAPENFLDDILENEADDIINL